MARTWETDVLVIGAGIAGLEAALESAKAGLCVLVVNKGACASTGILGFNAPVGLDDSAELYAADTFRGGWELGNRRLVDILATESADTVWHMEELGLCFDRLPGSEEYRLLQPLGCSAPRLVCHGNETGRRSLNLLREKTRCLGVLFLENTMALDFLTDNGEVYGVSALTPENGEVYTITAGAVVLATGGGHVMRGSTYPACQTGDGIAMAWRTGAVLVDMEFVQFEPCRAVWPKPLGLSTTLLAKGGILRNRLGERFVRKSYPREGDVPKDILARLIATEVLEGRGTEHDGVYLDLSGLPEEEIRVNHRLYYERFLSAGIDLIKEPVEVGPAPHSLMGGVLIGPDAATSLPGLYAAGEVTGGLHGANRLGGNAGSEVYVFGRIAGKNAAAWALASAKRTPTEAATAPPFCPSEGIQVMPTAFYEELKTEARDILYRGAGPVRDGVGLSAALGELNVLSQKLATPPNGCIPLQAAQEANNLLTVGKLICTAALRRKESRGVHFRRDYPERDDQNGKRHIALSPGTI